METISKIVVAGLILVVAAVGILISFLNDHFDKHDYKSK